MFGDPHFVTLDGKNYTFNGCGWYTYFHGVIPGNNENYCWSNFNKAASYSNLHSRSCKYSLTISTFENENQF